MTDQKRKYLVVKATPEKKGGVNVNGQQLEFGKKTHAFTVNDPGLAREIEAQHGQKYVGDAVVIPIGTNPDPLHRRTFTVPEMPWKRKKADNGEQ